MDAIGNLDLLSAGTAIAAIGVLGFITFFHNRKSITNQTFLLLALVTMLWSLVNYFFYQFAFPDIALWLLRLVIFLGTWHMFINFQLLYVFPREKGEFPRLYRCLLMPLVATTSVLTLTPLVFSHVVEVSADGKILRVANGPGIVIFASVVLGLFIGVLYQLVYKARQARGMEKLQFRFLASGLAFSLLLLVLFNFILPAFFDNPRFVPYGPLFTLPFVAAAAYAIIRHRLLNLKVISTGILVFLLADITLFEIIFSGNLPVLLLRSSVFLLVLTFGILLIKNVLQEVRHRELLEDLTAKLESANKELRKLDQAKSEFISLASHQLRAPMTIIKGYISMLLEGSLGEVTALIQEKMRMVFFSAEQMIKLVGDLLNLSRIESGKIRYSFEKLNFISFVEDVMREFSENAEKKGISISFANKTGSSLVLRFDKDKMREALINLLDNAIKYSKDQGHIVIGLNAVAGNRVRVDVADDGMGIKPEDIRKLFTKFGRTEEAIRHDPNGMGIGLYFVKRVVEDHGGTVGVESHGLGTGSTFFVELPLIKRESRIAEQNYFHDS